MGYQIRVGYPVKKENRVWRGYMEVGGELLIGGIVEGGRGIDHECFVYRVW